MNRDQGIIAVRQVFVVLLCLLGGCSGVTVTVNSQPVYDPQGRVAPEGELTADLQGCINLAIQQQDVADATELTVLSCANSEIRELEHIAQLSSLRFLDLGNNNIRNITPLEDLRLLSGLNLNNNVIDDIRPLLNITNLTSVSLVGNDTIPCSQLALLRNRLGENLLAPLLCRN
ncbi:MAG: leucine-rich repeat domain-containing protein [Gammaproteobacteria bacterium]